MLHPELTASATRAEASEVRKATYDAYLSSNRTCELGMTRATGQTYRHVLEMCIRDRGQGLAPPTGRREVLLAQPDLSLIHI